MTLILDSDQVQGGSDGRKETSGIRLAGPGKIGRCPMIDGGANNRKAQSDVDRTTEPLVLQDWKSLVVIHRQDRIGLFQMMR